MVLILSYVSSTKFGLNRQYIPKGKEFDDIEQNELNVIENN